MLRSDVEQKHGRRKFTLQKIIAGEFDDDIREWAHDAKHSVHRSWSSGERSLTAIGSPGMESGTAERWKDQNATSLPTGISST